MGNRRLPGFKWADGTSPTKEEQESSRVGFTLLCLLPPTTRPQCLCSCICRTRWDKGDKPCAAVVSDSQLPAWPSSFLHVCCSSCLIYSFEENTVLSAWALCKGQPWGGPQPCCISPPKAAGHGVPELLSVLSRTQTCKTGKWTLFNGKLTLSHRMKLCY